MPDTCWQFIILQIVGFAIDESVRFLEMIPERIMKSDKYLLAISTYALAISNSTQKAKFLDWLLTEAIENKGTFFSTFFINKLYVFIVFYHKIRILITHLFSIKIISGPGKYSVLEKKHLCDDVYVSSDFFVFVIYVVSNT